MRYPPRNEYDPLGSSGFRPTHNKDITVLLSSQKTSRAVSTNNQFMEAFQSRLPFNLAEIKMMSFFSQERLRYQKRLPKHLFSFGLLSSLSMLTAHTVPTSSASHASLLKMEYNGFQSSTVPGKQLPTNHNPSQINSYKEKAKIWKLQLCYTFIIVRRSIRRFTETHTAQCALNRGRNLLKDSNNK